MPSPVDPSAAPPPAPRPAKPAPAAASAPAQASRPRRWRRFRGDLARSFWIGTYSVIALAGLGYLRAHPGILVLEVDDTEEATPGDQREGGTGTRAAPEQNKRYAVQGPPADPHLARQEALNEAAEFGMIGLIGTGAGGGGRAEARGNQWGSDIEDSFAKKSKGSAPRGPQGSDPTSGEVSNDHGINEFIVAARDRLSTFAIDVDTGSYALARRKLVDGSLPTKASVRVEEFLNSFDYGYVGPESGATPEERARAFRVHVDAAPSPWNSARHLVRVGVQGKRVPRAARKPVHLTYLVDTSGSMQSKDKIGLVQTSLRYLTGTLRPGDTVGIATYAGDVREVLTPTDASRRETILDAIDALTASGSTAMASGIDLAYRLAERSRRPGEVSRVVVLSDGDANVGPSSQSDLLDRIKRHRGLGIQLSTVGYGVGNYKDSNMERLADAGDGNYSYIDSPAEARRVFSSQVDGLLEVIARDVKIQVEFDPAVVKQYRLVGYENRAIADRDFRNDRVDAGEIGAGHSVTALYEVELASAQGSPLTVRIRHKAPEGSEEASEQEFALDASHIAARFEDASASFHFAASVASFAELLRESPYVPGLTYARAADLARASSEDRVERAELVRLAERAASLELKVARQE